MFDFAHEYKWACRVVRYIYSTPFILRPPMGPLNMESYIAGGLKNKFSIVRKNFTLGPNYRLSYNQGGLNIIGCLIIKAALTKIFKIEGPLYYVL